MQRATGTTAFSRDGRSRWRLVSRRKLRRAAGRSIIASDSARYVEAEASFTGTSSQGCTLSQSAI
eukprot:1514561-Pleurochrysis_carterae.AAC.1